MSTEASHADQVPVTSPAGTTDPRLIEALRKALLRSLCHKMHSLWDRQQVYTASFQRLAAQEAVAEMIGDLVGLKGDVVIRIFDDAYDNGEHMGDRLVEELDPLLTRGLGAWMIEGCF